MSKVDKWSNIESFEAIGSHWEPYGVISPYGAIGTQLEPNEAIGRNREQ